MHIEHIYETNSMCIADFTKSRIVNILLEANNILTCNGILQENNCDFMKKITPVTFPCTFHKNKTNIT